MDSRRVGPIPVMNMCQLEDVGEGLGDLGAGLAGRAKAGPEDAAEVEEPLAGERAEDGRGGGLGHGDRRGEGCLSLPRSPCRR